MLAKILIQTSKVQIGSGIWLQQIRYKKYGRNTDRQPIRLECFGLLVRFYSNIDYSNFVINSSIENPFMASVWPVATIFPDLELAAGTELSYPLRRRWRSSVCLDWSPSPWETSVWSPPVQSAQGGLSPGGRPAGSGSVSWETGSCPRTRYSSASWRRQKGLWAEHLLYNHSKAKKKSMFLYLESRIVRVKYRRYLKRVVESCSFKNSSSLYLKSESAKRNMICVEKWETCE